MLWCNFGVGEIYGEILRDECKNVKNQKFTP